MTAALGFGLFFGGAFVGALIGHIGTHARSTRLTWLARGITTRARSFFDTYLRHGGKPGGA
jgi:hypothetical protein